MSIKHPKTIFVVGGVMSSVGKGVTTSSIATIMQSRGYSVTAMKADPYINVDAGTMNPTEHGEVFVTDDGDETDQDIGNYERFTNTDINSVNYMTTGRVYQEVINRERNLEYGGKTVEVVPHIPEEIIRRIKEAQRVNDADMVVVEIGGTVGEYQNILFLEAPRMMQQEHREDVAIVLVSYLPIPSSVGEMKTKPTQHAVRLLNGAGLQPDFIVARSSKPLDDIRRDKIASFCSVEPDNVIGAPDLSNIYAVPGAFEEQGLSNQLLKRFGLKAKRVSGKQNTVQQFNALVKKIESATEEVRIGIVGKYFATGEFVLADSYISVIQALKHAAWKFGRKAELVWLDAEEYEKDPSKVSELSEFDGVLIPGGFGSRGIEGKIAAIKHVRENNIPYFGLCYGMQLATVEFARNVAGLEGANTVEIDEQATHPIIIINPNQRKNVEEENYGGTLRLGAYDCELKKGSRAREAYASAMVSERHRHRYEFNNDYMQQLEDAGLVISGTNPQQDLVEIVELADHPWFVGVQFHPEFKSRPLSPHPLFVGFIEAAMKNAEQ